MKITKEIIEKYLEMKNSNKVEDFLDEKSFGKIKVFINKEPKNLIFKLKEGEDIIYIGTN